MHRGLLAVITAAMVVGGCGLTSRPEPPPLLVEAPDVVADEQSLTVHVAGAVVRPGLVVLAPGARIADAVAAAGGATHHAAVGSVNLATLVRDGDQIVIPQIGEEITADAGAGRISLNRATVSDLETLPGVGPVTAQRIVDHRDEYGPFSTLEDLLDVSGIGEAKLAAIRDSVVVP
ncbi:MAG: competence protein ComEA [Acidimicrobiia bacterium]|nr:helix-hairpin-helix domain-containing protein [Acidimicrobiia bacterium]NNF64125.1 competence protein ComEA [Acidimicrobiia bacterium]